MSDDTDHNYVDLVKREKRSQEYHAQFWADVRALVDAGREVVVRPLHKKSRCAILMDPKTNDTVTVELRDPADEPEPYAEGVSHDPGVEQLLERLR